MNKQDNVYLVMQDEGDNVQNHHEEILSFCDGQKSRLQGDLSFLSNAGKNNSKLMRTLAKNNHNQQLQDLLQLQTTIYGNRQNLSTQKKRLFSDLSFFSKDYTHDYSNQQGYNEVMYKIHFQRSRNRQLNQQLADWKQKTTQKYLKNLMQQLKQLGEQNRDLRQMYKKQAGGGYKQIIKKNQSMKQQEQSRNQTHYKTQNHKTGRRSIAGGVSGNEVTMHIGAKNSALKQRRLYGAGNNNFCQTQKLQGIRQSNKMQYCQSSINIQGESLVPSLKHKRRQSQLTQRKDYPQKYNSQNDYLIVFDNNSQISFDNQVPGRMSQPDKVPRHKYTQQTKEQQSINNPNNWTKAHKKGGYAQSIQRNSANITNQCQVTATSSKNIFIQLLQHLLLEEKIAYQQFALDMDTQIGEQQHNFNIPSYNNIKLIEQIEKQIMTKNLKLKQLQQVINVFRLEIQEIIGTDINTINSLMVELLEVKGKYIEMQDKVSGITGVKNQLLNKQRVKEQILQTIKQRMDRNIKQALQKQQSTEQIDQGFQVFHIPQSLKILFQFLNITINKNPKPIHYLNQIKELPKNKQLFQAFDSKNRASCNIKIKQTIDSIRQGRKKFNQVIKIYESRILKLQQKLVKYKNNQKNHQKVNQKQKTVQK